MKKITLKNLNKDLKEVKDENEKLKNELKDKRRKK